MKEKMLMLLEVYSSELSKHQHNQYITKLRDYFVPYLIDKYSEIEISQIFTNEFTRSDIIYSTIHYIKTNTNVKSRSAIDAFLIALNSFFQKKILKDFVNQNIIILIPFNQLADEINTKLLNEGIILDEKIANPSINFDEYEFIVQYLDNSSNQGRLMTFQRPIILQLFMIYGFSFDKLADLKIEDYNTNRNSLSIEFHNDKRNIMELELPFNFRNQFSELFKFRGTKAILNSHLLFVTETNKKISHNAAFQELDKIRNAYEELMGIEYGKDQSNPFTATGLQKFAIINMLLAGMNETIISSFTNQKKEILNDCQIEVSERHKVNMNRYINSLIRGIFTYDSFNRND